MDKKIVIISFLLLPIIIMTTGPARAQLVSGERAVLDEFYISTGGNNWIDHTDWDSGVSECLWNGITCNQDMDHIQEIRLPDNNLSGSIPPEIDNLSGLQWLDLSGNTPLAGSTIPSMSNLLDLRHLNLRDCGLIGSIPDLSTSSFLNFLNLEDNSLGDPNVDNDIPNTLGSLDLLRSLLLSNNNLTGTIPPDLESLDALLTLDLSQNRLEGEIPSELGGLDSLQYLYLYGNKLDGPIPGNLDDDLVDTLTYCDIRWNALYTSDDDLSTFFTDRQAGGDWESYQTIAPTNLDAGDADDGSITLTWTAIAYTGDNGGYEVWYRPSGGSWKLFETTSDKTVTTSTVTGLSSGTNYSFRVRTLTEQHTNNPDNDVYSQYATTSATTTGEDDEGGCFINTTTFKVFSIFK